MSEHGDGAPGTVATTDVHPRLCCVFMILLPGVPGRAWSSACGDGPELRHRQTDLVNLYIRFATFWSWTSSKVAP